VPDPDTATALKVALRHYDDKSTTDRERDAILGAFTKHFDGPEGEAAARALFHREKAREEQLVLTNLLDRPNPNS
jgi:hypothetical protein